MNIKTKTKLLLLCAGMLATFSFSSCEKTDETSTPIDGVTEPVEEVTEPAEDSLPVATNYSIVETGQTIFYNNTDAISGVSKGEAFFGQDANYEGNTPNYIDNQDGTISDMVTGLMWQKSADTNGDGTIDYNDKMSYEEAMANAENMDLGGYTDWRLPSIKEQYSLIMFYGLDPSGYNGTNTDELVPFIDADYFDIAYGDEAAGERIIDAQFATSTKYVSTTMMGDETMFGVNFVDGRIKGYPTGAMPGQTEDKQFYVLYVRGNSNYGINDFIDNSDGTISDEATGLMWMQDDLGEGMNWEEALSAAEESEFAGYDDWRLPDAKELHSILDYTRSPETSNSAAINELFNCTQITNEIGQVDYACYWSSTTHANMINGANAAYVSFGRAMGNMHGSWMDVHGAGAQRSDPKMGDPNDYPEGHGPQGDAIRILNQVRLVRNK